jgi:hypothetical protein
MASTFFRRPRSPNLLGRRSCLCYGGYWSILPRRPGRWGRGLNTTLPGASSRRPLPTTFWEKMLQFPTYMYRDRDNTVIGASHLSPTDSVITTLGNKGMKRRLSTESRPPVALGYSHVAFNQEFRGMQYDGCGDDWLSKYEYAATNFAETCAWGGWLRAAETFSFNVLMYESIFQYFVVLLLICPPPYTILHF